MINKEKENQNHIDTEYKEIHDAESTKMNKRNLKVEVSKQLGIKTSKKRAIERSKALKTNDVNILEDLKALTAYIEGASIEDISEQFDIKIDTLKSRTKKLKEHGIRSVLDLRETNGKAQEKIINKKIAHRIIELKIKEPELGSRGISKRLYEQDGTQISHVSICNYLIEIQFNDYTPSEYSKGSFSP